MQREKAGTQVYPLVISYVLMGKQADTRLPDFGMNEKECEKTQDVPLSDCSVSEDGRLTFEIIYSVVSVICLGFGHR